MPDEGTATAEAVATEVTPAVSGDEPVVTPEEAPATPAAEEVAVTQEVVVPQEDEPQKPLSRREARKDMHQKRQARRAAEQAEAAKAAEATETPATVPEDAGAVAEGEPAAPVIDEKGRKHDPATGEFLPGEKPGETDAPPVVTQEAAQAAEPAETEPTPDSLRVSIPLGHALGKMNAVTEITTGSPEEAEVVRAAFSSTGVRRKELEKAQKRTATVEAENLELRDQVLRQESSSTAEEQWKLTPEYTAHVEEYQNIHDAVGQKGASGYWQGAPMADFRKFEEAEFGKRTTEAKAEREAENSQRWMDDAWEQANFLPDVIRRLPNFKQMFVEEAQAFNARLDLKHYPEIETLEAAHEKFRSLLSERINREATVKAMRSKDAEGRGRKDAMDAVRSQRAKDALAARSAEAGKTAVDQAKRDAAERRADAPPHPMGALPSGPRTGQEAVAAVETDPTADMTPFELRKYHKTANREAQRERVRQR